MEYVTIGTSLFLILMGFLVKKYPNLIAGYNTMSAERKKKVDIEGLSNWMQNCLIVMGFFTMACYLTLKYMGHDKLADASMTVTIIGGTLIMLIGAQRYDHANLE